jgi:hypothetical protein
VGLGHDRYPWKRRVPNKSLAAAGAEVEHGARVSDELVSASIVLTVQWTEVVGAAAAMAIEPGPIPATEWRGRGFGDELLELGIRGDRPSNGFADGQNRDAVHERITQCTALTINAVGGRRRFDEAKCIGGSAGGALASDSS